MNKSQFIFLLFFIVPMAICAQEDSLRSDSIINPYIKEYHLQLNVKLNASTEYFKFKVPYNGEEVNLLPNIGTRFAVDFSYKFAFLSIGFRAPLSDAGIEKKGNSDVFKIKFGLLFDRWAHQLEYNRIKGYYIQNTEDINDLGSDFERYIQFPDLISNTFSGSSFLKLNEFYSMKAIESQTEIQLKSVGTFMPILDYRFYSLNGFDKVLTTEGEEIIRQQYTEYTGFQAVINMAYYYTFVYKKWYANVNIKPGVGVNLYHSSIYTSRDDYKQFSNDLVFSFQSGLGLGYSGEKYYFGFKMLNQFSWEKYSIKNSPINRSINSFHIFVGHRFKAPKTITKPIDGIQKRVPLLN